MPELHPHVGHVRLVDVVPVGPPQVVLVPHPVRLHVVLEARLVHAVPGDFTQVTRAQLPNLGKR
jgi:hypothetical protein